jgi:hypothetical protein
MSEMSWWTAERQTRRCETSLYLKNEQFFKKEGNENENDNQPSIYPGTHPGVGE